MFKLKRTANTRLSISVALTAIALIVLSTNTELAPNAEASLSSAKAISCNIVTPATIHATVGISVGKPTSVANGAVTVCTYKTTGGAIGTVLVRFETGVSNSAWTAGRKSFDSHGEPTKTVNGLGNGAFSSVIGSGMYLTSTISVLKKSTDLQISAPASLSKVEALAKKVLPSL